MDAKERCEMIEIAVREAQYAFARGDTSHPNSRIAAGIAAVRRAYEIDGVRELVEAAEKMLPLFVEVVIDGGCDHSVGICACGDIQLAEDMKSAAARVREAIAAQEADEPEVHDDQPTAQRSDPR